MRVMQVHLSTAMSTFRSIGDTCAWTDNIHEVVGSLNSGYHMGFKGRFHTTGSLKLDVCVIL